MYRDRQEAGAVLADLLVREQPARVQTQPPPVVVGLPRGGVPVAAVVARVLGAPLEVFVAKKIGIPGHEEVGVGAVAEGGVVVLDEDLLRRCGLDAADLRTAIATKAHEVTARAARFRGGRPAPDWRGRTVVVVDDGVANGVTAAAALRGLRAAGASSLVLAVPVGSREGLARCAAEADAVLCPLIPVDFRAVGEHFVDFTQVEDHEVDALLAAPPAASLAGPHGET
jgi:predicted phosphoribosyltransferase